MTKFAMKKDVSPLDKMQMNTNHDMCQNLTERAEIMLEQAEKIDSRAFVTARVKMEILITISALANDL